MTWQTLALLAIDLRSHYDGAEAPLLLVVANLLFWPTLFARAWIMDRWDAWRRRKRSA